MAGIPVVILCGGKGTRLGEGSIPKALVRIGDRSILRHLIDIYMSYGHDRFILCLGFGREQVEQEVSEGYPGEILCVDTGLDTPTGGRIKLVGDQLDGTFMATYVDGLSDVDLGELLDAHRRSGRFSTITCPRVTNPFGLVNLEGDRVTGFEEKPLMQQRINGGFFVFEPEVLGYIEETSILEREPFERLARDGQMTAFPHDGFWACMDTYKDALTLNELWSEGAPWMRAQEP